jgi:four helix bundle protein
VRIESLNHRGIESLQPEYSGSLKKADELRKRTKSFAIRIVHLFRALPRSPDAQTLGKQVLRSGTSVAANYRAVCRARSKAEFVSKMGIVVEEADETVFWLEIMVETELIPQAKMQGLQKEANELLAIFSASLRTARRDFQ